MGYVIVNVQDVYLCWSNTDGWVEEGFDTFSPEEKEILTLPMGGMWEMVSWAKKD